LRVSRATSIAVTYIQTTAIVSRASSFRARVLGVQVEVQARQVEVRRY
jgi:hypothetical protein